MTLRTRTKYFTYDCRFIIKDITQKQPNGRDAEGKVWEISTPALGPPPSQYLDVFIIEKLSRPPCLGVSVEVPLSRNELVKSLALVINSVSSPSSFPRLEAGHEICFNVLITCLASLATSSHSEAV